MPHTSDLELNKRLLEPVPRGQLGTSLAQHVLDNWFAHVYSSGGSSLGAGHGRAQWQMTKLHAQEDGLAPWLLRRPCVAPAGIRT